MFFSKEQSKFNNRFFFGIFMTQDAHCSFSSRLKRYSLFPVFVVLCLITPIRAQIPGVTSRLIAPSTTEHDLTCLRLIDENSAVAIGSQNSLVRTDDRGLTWREITTRPFINYVRALEVITPTRWLGMNGVGYVFLTTDGGESFSYSRPGYGFPSTYDEYEISFADSMNGIIRFINSTQNFDYYLTNDGGFTWTHRSFVSQATYLYAVVFPGSVVVVATTDKMIRSTDFGATWSSSFPFVAKGFFKYDDSTAFFTTATDSVYKTTNKGLSWHPLSHPQSGIQARYMSRLPDGTVYNFHPELRTIDRSTDTCKSFITVRQLPGTGNTMRFYKSFLMFAPDQGIAVGERGTVTAVSGPNLSVRKVSRNHLYATEAFWVDTLFSIAGQGEWTKDGGTNWTYSSFPQEVGKICFPVAGKKGYAVSAQNRKVVSWPPPFPDHYLDIAVSVDSGKSWQGRVSDTGIKALDVTALNDSLFVVLGEGNIPNYTARFYIFSLNNGILQKTEYSGTKQFFKVAAFPARNALLATSGHTLYISFDTAKTWNTFHILPPHAELTAGDVLVSGERIAVVVNPGLCFESSDAGVTWKTRYGTLNYTVNDRGPYDLNHDGMIAFRKGDELFMWSSDGGTRPIHKMLQGNYITFLQFAGEHSLFVTTNKQAVIKFNIDSTFTSLENENNILPETNQLDQNYPNPFNPVTTILFDLLNPGFTTGIVYDILGNEVETLLKSEVEAGRHRLEFNAGALPSGIYFFRLNSGGYTKTIKMMLCK